jgi:hypothetical protein
LLEILVSLAVLGILLTGLAQGSRFVLSGWDRHARLVARNQDLDAVDRTLRRLIMQASPDSEQEPLAFVGSANSVAFTSVVPASGTSVQRADVKLVVDRAHRLLLLWTPHLHAVRAGPQPGVTATEILRGVAKLDFAYWPAKLGGGWTEVWRGPDLPRLVRVRILFTDPRQASWPDIVVAPMLEP